MRPHDNLLNRNRRVLTIAVVHLLILSLALLAGCGDAVQGTWEARLTCADLKGSGHETYHCDPKVSPYKGSWSQTIRLDLSGDAFEYTQTTGSETSIGQTGFYVYDEAAGTLQLRYCDNGHGCVGEWAIDNPALEREDWRVSLSDDGEQLVARAGNDAYVMPFVLEGRPLTFSRR